MEWGGFGPCCPHGRRACPSRGRYGSRRKCRSRPSTLQKTRSQWYTTAERKQLRTICNPPKEVGRTSSVNPSHLQPENVRPASSATSVRNPSPSDHSFAASGTSFESSRPPRLSRRSTARISAEIRAHLEDLRGVLWTAPSQRLPESTY